MLTLIIIIAALCLIFIILAQFTNFSDETTITLLNLWFCSAVVVVMLLVYWGVATLAYNCRIAEFEQMQSTLNNARSEGFSEFERLAIQDKIIEYNTWLARAKFFNSLWINCVPDKIENLNPIK